MRYAILLQQNPNGQFQASVPLIPGLTQVGNSRTETLEAVRQAITSTLNAAELVYLDIPEAQPGNPWLATAGLFADDPTLESMLQDIYAARDAE